jgi:hypothetical protein
MAAIERKTYTHPVKKCSIQGVGSPEIVQCTLYTHHRAHSYLKVLGNTYAN